MTHVCAFIGGPCRWRCKDDYCAYLGDVENALNEEDEIPKDAVKFDAGKVDLLFLFEYFPDALEAVCWVAEYGERKYARGGWKGVSEAIPRYTKALLRHFRLSFREPYDSDDSGLPHAAQVAWNALAVLQKQIEGGLVEIRRGNEIKDGKPIHATAQKVA